MVGRVLCCVPEPCPGADAIQPCITRRAAPAAVARKQLHFLVGIARGQRMAPGCLKDLPASPVLHRDEHRTELCIAGGVILGLLLKSSCFLLASHAASSCWLAASKIRLPVHSCMLTEAQWLAGNLLAPCKFVPVLLGLARAQS